MSVKNVGCCASKGKEERAYHPSLEEYEKLRIIGRSS
jgi:hypothetical protein